MVRFAFWSALPFGPTTEAPFPPPNKVKNPVFMKRVVMLEIFLKLPVGLNLSPKMIKVLCMTQ